MTRPRAQSLVGAALAAALLVAMPAGAAESLRFWNLTTATITELRLAPAGTEHWGPNQCDNDPDKSVDADERLRLTGLTPGRYDVQLADKTGRRCTVRDVEVKGDGHYAFSIAETDLTDCRK